MQKQEGLQRLEQEQLTRQAEGDLRAKAAQESNERKLREIGCESALPYGQQLFAASCDFVAKYLSETFEQFLLEPYKARAHAAALPFFNEFSGAHHIAAIALTAAINQMSKRQKFPTFIQHLGLAIEREARLIKLGKNAPLEMRKLFRDGMSRKEVTSRDVMRALKCPILEWDDRTRAQVGAFLCEAIFATEMLKPLMIRRGIRKYRIVVPTEQAEEFIRNCKPKDCRRTSLSMLVPPRDWVGLYGGGFLNNEEPVVKPVLYDHGDEGRLDHYLKADLSHTIKGLNFLQSHCLNVSAEIVSIQRTTWETGIEGLWPCSRIPPEIPDRLGNNPSAAELKTRNRIAAANHRNREKNCHRRIKIERSIQIAEEVIDRSIYQAWYFCHRGRGYTSNPVGSTMGASHEKAQLSFAEQLPVNAEGFEWLLKAAAGHQGMGRDTWEDRLTWGQNNIDLMIAAAENPLGKLELWRGAKQPWEFLQLCIGVRDARATGKSGAFIRFDQTTSGPGILAALTRHEGVGRLCNLYGDTPQDLYSVIADNCNAKLRHDLELGEDRAKALAQLWLKFGITRSTVKPSVLRAPYGGMYMSVADSLIDVLEEHVGYVPIEDYLFKISSPSKYMASILWAEMNAVIAPVMQVKAWLRACCRKLMNKQHPMEWTTPSGWPMRIADRLPKKVDIRTTLFGKKACFIIEDQPVDAPLSPNQASKALPANTVHSFDSAMFQRIIYEAARHRVPVIPTHDCFACSPANATQLHNMLLHEFGQIFRKPLLEQMRQEMQDRTGIQLPKPPCHGSLDPMAIGSNPYLFS